MISHKTPCLSRKGEVVTLRGPGAHVKMPRLLSSANHGPYPTRQNVRSESRQIAMVSVLGSTHILSRLYLPPWPAVQHRHTASERNRLVACRPRLESFAARYPGTLASHAGSQHPLASRYRPCRHRDAKCRRKAVAKRRNLP